MCQASADCHNVPVMLPFRRHRLRRMPCNDPKGSPINALTRHQAHQQGRVSTAKKPTPTTCFIGRNLVDIIIVGTK